MARSPGSIYQPGWGVTNSCRLDTLGACQDLVDHIAPLGYFSELCHLPNDDFLSQYNIKPLLAREKKAMRFFSTNAGLARSNGTGHGLRLAVMKCAESSEIRRAFADVVSAGLAKGMSEGLRYGIEHGKAGRDLMDVEAYDPEANRKFVKALQDLKDLKYSMVDELERLKDAPVELIMASLHLESDTGEDAPQWIRDLRPSSLQLKIPIYPEVRDPKDPWAKEEMLLEDAIAANKSRAKKKKKCRVVCRTHGIGSAHHPRSDGIPVSAPTVVPQGLAILVADAATQTEAANKEEEPHLIVVVQPVALEQYF
ncbi:hypothetical protein Tco_0221359 [Tanacetum coccineum]